MICLTNFEDILKQWKSYDIKSVNELDYYLDNFRILFAYNSNHIENPNTTYHDTREIFEHGKISSFTGDLRTLYEIDNQRICYEFLKDKIINKEPLSQELIKKIHKILMRGCYSQAIYDKGERPGEYKKHLFVVGDDVGVAPEDVPTEIEYILDEIRENEGGNPLKIAAYLHLSFESIHPFADGNGRLGRTLMNYYLITHNYPPVIIYSEDRETYYMALAVFDKTGRIDGFERFIEEQTTKTWNSREHKRVSLSEKAEKKNESYYLEVSKAEADLLKNAKIPFWGNIAEQGISIIKISPENKEKANQMLDNFRNKSNIPKK